MHVLQVSLSDDALLRRAMEISQSDPATLSGGSGVPMTVIDGFLDGYVAPTEGAVQLLAKALGVQPSSLWPGLKD